MRRINGDALPERPPQLRESCTRAGVPLAGENALPCFMPGVIDEIALQRVVYNTQVG
jgi:hypothetical protein